MLVRAKLPSPTTNNNNTRSCRAGFSRCRRGGDLCMMCVTSPARASSHTSTNTGETWPITSQVTCTTKNCVYRITCEKQCGECKKILPYIGKKYVPTLTNGQAIVDTYRTSVLPQSFQDTLDLHDLLETPLNYGSRDDSS